VVLVLVVMEINYIKGLREEFLAFVDSISEEDRVAIVSHIDVDGLSSAVFLEKILDARGIDVKFISFEDIRSDMVKEVSVKLNDEEITKVFFSDIGIDSIDFEGFKELREEMGVFLIDHHPMNEAVKDWDNIIKTDSQDCSAMTCFFLGEGLIDSDEWDWLCCAAIFSDFSYKERKNLEYIQSVYPDVTYDNISSTVPGLNGRKINSALIYYENDKRYVFDLVKNRNLEKIEEAHDVLEEEIERLILDFSEKAEHYTEKGLHFYLLDSRFNITSTVCSLVSKMKPEDYFVFGRRIGGGFIKFSARNQSGNYDMGALMKRCVEGLDCANGGGHKAAAAARILEKDLDVFKKRLFFE
jgi:single-stranded DNA-specific DHH superfamily exonuclease